MTTEDEFIYTVTRKLVEGDHEGALKYMNEEAEKLISTLPPEKQKEARHLMDLEGDELVSELKRRHPPNDEDDDDEMFPDEPLVEMGMLEEIARRSVAAMTPERKEHAMWKMIGRTFEAGLDAMPDIGRDEILRKMEDGTFSDKDRELLTIYGVTNLTDLDRAIIKALAEGSR